MERVAIDTGSFRDDILHDMLGLRRVLEHGVWGSLNPHMIAAASSDPVIAEIQAQHADYHQTIVEETVERAIQRGEISAEFDPTHVALLFYAPIIYRVHARSTALRYLILLKLTERCIDAVRVQSC